MDIKLFIAVHKPYPIPDDQCYIPIQAGADLNKIIKSFTPDNSGDNISYKNKSFCELTVLYWFWKNCNYEYAGLVHYRRYFAVDKKNKKWSRIAKQADIEAQLKKVHVILPPKRRYYIETNYSQYIHAHNKSDLDITHDILQEKYPEYLPYWDIIMSKTSGHRFNIFIMKDELLNRYCNWLFDILFELENRLDITCYDSYNTRVFGFVAERLLDIWIAANHINYTEMKIVNLDNQRWIRKIASFIKRKYAIKRRS